MKIIFPLILSAILLCVGFFTYSTFFGLSIKLLKPHQIQFNQTYLSTLSPIWLYLTSLASIPIFYIAIKNLVTLKSKIHSTFIYASMLLFGILLWWLRILQLNSRFDEIESYKLGSNITNSFDVNQLYLSHFFASGIVLGAFFSFVILILLVDRKQQERTDDKDDLNKKEL